VEFDQVIAPIEGVFAQEVDGEMVLLDSQSKHYFGLDGVGRSIWDKLQTPQTLQAVYDAILEEYAVAPEVLRADLVTFIQSLHSHHLIEVED